MTETTDEHRWTRIKGDSKSCATRRRESIHIFTTEGAKGHEGEEWHRAGQGDENPQRGSEQHPPGPNRFQDERAVPVPHRVRLGPIQDLFLDLKPVPGNLAARAMRDLQNSVAAVAAHLLP